MFIKFIGFSIVLSFIVQNINALPKNAKSSQFQVLNIANGEEPKTLDPQKCYESICGAIIMQLFEGLVQYDTNGKVIPSSAESWKISPDGKTYVFYLRKNLKWSDGFNVTASDFVYSFQRLVDPKTAADASYLLEFVLNGKEIIEGKLPVTSLGVKAINETTLEIKLRIPMASFLENLTFHSTFPVQKSNIDKYQNEFTDAGKLVSNGAFNVIYRKVGDKITVEKNPYYWDREKIYLEKVNFFPVVDQNTEFSMYKTGQIDITSTIPVNQYKQIKAKYSKEFVNEPNLTSYNYVFNTQSKPLNNKSLRKALSIAIDRNAISYAILGMGQLPLYDIVPYGLKNYKQSKTPWQDWPRAKQIEEAKKLYKEAGYSDSKPLAIQILYNTNESHKKIATAIASMWKQNLGVNTFLKNEEWKVLLDKRKNGDFLILRLGNIADINDASAFLASLRSTDISNDSKYKNPEYDLIVDQALQEPDVLKRKELFERAGKIIMEDVPIVPIYSAASSYLVKLFVNGFKKNNLGKYILSNVYIEDKKSLSE